MGLPLFVLCFVVTLAGFLAVSGDALVSSPGLLLVGIEPHLKPLSRLLVEDLGSDIPRDVFSRCLSEIPLREPSPGLPRRPSMGLFGWTEQFGS